MIWIVFGVLFLVLLVLFLFAILYEYCFSKKLEIQSILKKYLVHVLVVIFLFALITPLILYFFGLFKEKRALENSDILGYYGALIGGGVTVLGIYWTFNYERLISAEERKETSLPLLKFSLSMLTDEEESDNTEPYDLHTYRGLELNLEYDDLKKEEEFLSISFTGLSNQRSEILVAKNKNNKLESISKSYKDACLSKNLEKVENKIEEILKKQNKISSKLSEILFKTFSFHLKIENIGLQTAILSSMSLHSKNGISSRVQVVYEYDKDTTEKPEDLMNKDESTKLGMFAVPKETDTSLKIAFWYFDYKRNYSNKSNGSRDYDNGDYLLVEFTDVYLNRYRYKLPIKLRNFYGKYSVILDSKQIPINPEKI
ncbi:hypothetical protein [Streptococcus sp. HMSC065H07]|uniref:hypothetical protein n=1 Tax=Streptococcus sp. HMSC065H07 TaxID=1715116 RepID=UPI0008A9F3FD|nr:hypothetical protein [Streptococcus sp. HMSC065H07]OHQ22652.1 hypothetical protein HMPREF2637_04840 [Streptococcus sp. HMSC065H07]